MDPLKFETKFKSVPVTIAGSDGKEQQYELRELSGDARDEYVQDTGNRVRFGADGKPAGLKDFKGMQAKLISMSLFDAQGKNVPAKEINNWPATIVSALYKECQKISALN